MVHLYDVCRNLWDLVMLPSQTWSLSSAFVIQGNYRLRRMLFTRDFFLKAADVEGCRMPCPAQARSRKRESSKFEVVEVAKSHSQGSDLEDAQSRPRASLQDFASKWRH